MPWSHPAARMREYILAMRAIWAAWNDGEKLDFRRRLLPAHADDAVLRAAARTRTATPKVFLAAVGELMTEVAGEVADGIIIHGFTTERYVKEVTVPAIERGLAKAGRSRRVVRDLGSAVRRHRARTKQELERSEQGRRSSRSRSTARRPRTAACSSCTAGAICRPSSTRSSKQGEWVRDGRAHRRRHPAARSRSSPNPKAVGAELKRALRRRRRPLLVLRAVRVRPRALGAR